MDPAQYWPGCRLKPHKLSILHRQPALSNMVSSTWKAICRVFAAVAPTRWLRALGPLPSTKARKLFTPGWRDSPAWATSANPSAMGSAPGTGGRRHAADIKTADGIGKADDHRGCGAQFSRVGKQPFCILNGCGIGGNITARQRRVQNIIRTGGDSGNIAKSRRSARIICRVADLGYRTTEQAHNRRCWD